MFDKVSTLGLWFIVFCFLLLPLVLTLVVGIAFANFFGFTGLYWWSFILLFYILVFGFLGILFK